MHNWIVRVLVVIVVLILSPASADEIQPTDVVQPADAQSAPKAQFEISPNRCVTLRQGQPCFVRVKFKWRATQAVQVCLHNMQGESISCWQSSLQGSIVLPQTLPNTTEYVLVDAEGLELNRASVSVSWVYRKKRSKRRWRLF